MTSHSKIFQLQRLPGLLSPGVDELFNKGELMRTPAGPLESSPSATSSCSDMGSPSSVVRNKTVSSLFDKAAGVEDSEDFDIPAVRVAQQQGSVFRPSASSSLADLPLSKFKARHLLATQFHCL